MFNKILQSTGDFVTKNAPAILTGLGVAGTIATAVLAVHATPKATRDIMDANSEFADPISNWDKVRLTWHYYIPAATVGALTVATIIGAQSINHRRQAVLMSAYALAETSYREYREKTKEVIGETKESQIKDEMAKEHVMDAPMVNSEVILTGLGEHLVYESLSGRYFRSDIETIRKAVNDINQECLHHENASLNEFYDKIGLPPTTMGEDFGWRSDALMDVHYSSHIAQTSSNVSKAGEPALSIEYLTTPIKGYYHIHR